MEGKYKVKWREAKLLAEQRWQDWEDAKMGIKEDSQFLSLGDQRNDVAICRNRNVQICFWRMNLKVWVQI